MPKQASDPFPDALVEQLAAIAHERWSGWISYMFSKTIGNLDGTEEIPNGLVTRWRRQSETPYTDLPGAEKESDREEARAYLRAIFPPVVVHKEKPEGFYPPERRFP